MHLHNSKDAYHLKQLASRIGQSLNVTRSAKLKELDMS